MSKSLTIKSVEYAVALYNSKPEIGTSEIKKLFGISSSTVVCRLKKSAKEVMEKNGVECWNANTVDTECAYKAWKLDIVRLERMLSKLKKHDLQEVG